MKREQALARLWVNAGTLLIGNGLATIIGFASFALIARALEPSDLGILALIQAYVVILGSLISFQSWHAVTKFGADALQRKDAEDFKQLIKFGTLLDIVGALLGAITAVLLVYAVGQALDWEPYIVRLVIAYCFTIALDFTGTPKAVLRLFNRFNLIAIQQLVIAILKLLIIGMAYIMDAELVAFVLISAAIVILGNVSLSMLGWRELSLQGYSVGVQCHPLKFIRGHPGLWGFVWTTNVSSSIGVVTKEFDVLVVGGLLGSASAGVYRIVKQFAVVFSKPIEALYHAIYPELARLWASEDFSAFRGLVLQSGALSGAIALLVWVALALWGELLILSVVGHGYNDAFPVLLWYTLGMVVAVFAFPLQPAGFSMGLTRVMLIAHLVSTLFYIVCLPVSLIILGLPGAGISAILFQLIWALAMYKSQQRIFHCTDRAS